MNSLRFIFIISLSLLLINNCARQKLVENLPEELALIELMTGSFSSEQQSLDDTTYYNISLHMYQIWKNTNENWLYVEQALFDMQEKPYRQRVYKIEQTGENQYQSIVFSIKNDSLFIGKWKNPDFFDKFDQTILSEREGCTVLLSKTGRNIFEGSTREGECKSSLRGASYATSKVKVRQGTIESWDQGFDADGNQVWGATEGGYIFEIIK